MNDKLRIYRFRVLIERPNGKFGQIDWRYDIFHPVYDLSSIDENIESARQAGSPFIEGKFLRAAVFYGDDHLGQAHLVGIGSDNKLHFVKGGERTAQEAHGYLSHAQADQEIAYAGISVTNEKGRPQKFNRVLLVHNSEEAQHMLQQLQALPAGTEDSLAGEINGGVIVWSNGNLAQYIKTDPDGKIVLDENGYTEDPYAAEMKLRGVPARPHKIGALSAECRRFVR